MAYMYRSAMLLLGQLPGWRMGLAGCSAAHMGYYPLCKLLLPQPPADSNMCIVGRRGWLGIGCCTTTRLLSEFNDCPLSCRHTSGSFCCCFFCCSWCAAPGGWAAQLANSIINTNNNNNSHHHRAEPLPCSGVRHCGSAVGSVAWLFCMLCAGGGLR